MSEKFPVLLDGKVKGNLTVTAEGLVTRFEARCEDPGHLVRLSVYGGGREGYLGVMEPSKGSLYLCRRLSRAALKGFPASVEYAAEAGQKPPLPSEETRAEPSKAVSPPPAKKRAPPPRRMPAQQTLRQKPQKQQDTDLVWYPAGDGCLFTRWQGCTYRAVPMAAHGLPAKDMVEKRRIEGVDYAVYRLPPPSGDA